MAEVNAVGTMRWTFWRVVDVAAVREVGPRHDNARVHDPMCLMPLFRAARSSMSCSVVLALVFATSPLNAQSTAGISAHAQVRAIEYCANDAFDEMRLNVLVTVGNAGRAAVGRVRDAQAVGGYRAAYTRRDGTRIEVTVAGDVIRSADSFVRRVEPDEILPVMAGASFEFSTWMAILVDRLTEQPPALNLPVGADLTINALVMTSTLSVAEMEFARTLTSLPVLGQVIEAAPIRVRIEPPRHMERCRPK